MAIDVERSERIATVTMNRPEAYNAFSTQQLEDLLALFRELRDDRDVRFWAVSGRNASLL